MGRVLGRKGRRCFVQILQHGVPAIRPTLAGPLAGKTASPWNYYSRIPAPASKLARILPR